VLRLPIDGDRDVVLRWRNHPQVRRASLTTHEIDPTEHHAWWEAVAHDPSRRVLVYCRGERPAGVVTFTGLDSPDRAATWGFYLDVDGLQERDELLPAWMELEGEAVRYAFEDLELERIGGETLAWNTQVLALHRRFGFAVTDRYVRDVDGEPQEVVWTELSRGGSRWRR
jgi:UDP-4-amino-4,6-dideoxy-N-acetyl-beta-L-altrosamine N-acetyltransferase